MPELSIIIALYNTEQYIEQTIDSIIAQSFEAWELIIVDDRSTDSSHSIAKRYAAADPRIRVVQTPANTGSAKVPFDTGIEIAQSQWICCIGCDDYLDYDAVEKLITTQRRTGADIVYLRMQAFDNTTGDIIKSIPNLDFDFSQVLSGKQAMMLTIGGWQIGANGALIKRDIWTRRTNYHCNDICHMNADEYDTREMLTMARTVAFADTVYHYRIHSGSITHRVSAKLFETIITDRMVADLVGREFGLNSVQYSKAKTETIKEIKSKYHLYVRLAKRLSTEDRQYVERLIQTERARYSRSEIWQSDITFTAKLLLIAPRSIAMMGIKLFTPMINSRQLND